MTPRASIQYDALALAQSAKLGELDALAIEELVTRAEQELGSADPLYLEVSAFAVGAELVLRDGGDPAELGHKLFRAIEIDLVPTPPDVDRADIHG